MSIENTIPKIVTSRLGSFLDTTKASTRKQNATAHTNIKREKEFRGPRSASINAGTKKRKMSHMTGMRAFTS